MSPADPILNAPLAAREARRSRDEAGSHDSDSHFRELADAMPQIVWAALPDGTLDYYNRRWFEFIDLPTSAGEATAWHHYVHPDDAERVGIAWRDALRSGAQYSVEFRVRDGAGDHCWFLVRAEPVRDGGGAIVRWFGTCTDIEDRKRSEARDRFMLALDAAVRPLSDPAEITAAHARLLGEHLGADRCAYADVEADEDTFNLIGDYNRGVPSIVGRYRFLEFGAEVLRLMRADQPYVVHDVDAHEPPIADLTAYRATQIQAVVCVPMHKDGRFAAAMAVHQATPRRWRVDEVDLVRHVAGRCWESIERARVERTLRESEQRFRQLADAMPQIVWVARAGGSVEYFNRQWYDFTGVAHGATDGDGWTVVIHPDDLSRLLARWAQSLASGEPYEIEYRLRHRSGAHRWALARALPVRNARGEIERWFGTCTDIHGLRVLTDEREQLLASERAARSEVERAARIKDEFLTTLSHELRTPLNAIVGWANILTQAAADGDADLRDGLETILRNAQAQTQIIEDLLDMSRIVSGKVRLDLQPLDLATVLRGAVDTARPAADAKGVRVTAQVEPGVAATLIGDPGRLQQVFWNLLSNAVKFTPRGGQVTVALRRDGAHLQAGVTDTGEGIRAEFLPLVFDRFRQADSSTTRRHGGLGLGLAIVKQIVELHGGTVAVASGGVGQGATFTVRLPLVVPPPEAGAESHGQAGTAGAAHAQAHDGDLDPCPQLAGVRVLVVDDEPDARALVSRLLEDCDAVVRTAGSAAEAWDLFTAERPDVLLSDIGMPGEDGYALIRRVRALTPDRGGDVPAAALTAYARSVDRMRAVRAGYQTHLVKPVEPAELITVVASLTRKRGGTLR